MVSSKLLFIKIFLIENIQLDHGRQLSGKEIRRIQIPQGGTRFPPIQQQESSLPPQNQESLCDRRGGRYRQSDCKNVPFRRTPRGVLRRGRGSKETALQTGTSFFHVDISDREALENCMQQIFEEWGDIDIVINNAGISCFSPITETSVEDFDRILSINLRPVFITSRRLAIHRQSQESPNPFGRIVNICSTRYLMSEPGSEGYAASKGGIYSLTHALALSLAEWHITVNSISPGWIETRDYEQLRPEDHAQHPSGRVGRPEDIARMCLFICQEENDFMNGENVTIDGGMTKKMIYLE